jgi:hypothetical protein
MSLIKLSDTKQKAGQFRLRDGRSIRTVSALLLQLIQTSAHDVRVEAARIHKARNQKFALKRQESINENNSQKSAEEEDFLDEHDNEVSLATLHRGKNPTKLARRKFACTIAVSRAPFRLPRRLSSSLLRGLERASQPRTRMRPSTEQFLIISLTIYWPFFIGLSGLQPACCCLLPASTW